MTRQPGENQDNESAQFERFAVVIDPELLKRSA